MTVKNPNAPATEPQLNKIKGLLPRLSEFEQDTVWKTLRYWDDPEDGFKRGAASQLIDRLLQLPAAEPTGDLKRVVEHLEERGDKRNDFQESLYQQFQQRGSLSDKQIAAVIRKLPDENGKPKWSVPQVPDGRYAVIVNGEVRLYRVWAIEADKSRDGNRHQILYGVQGVEKGERVLPSEELAAATEIAKHPANAAREFGYRTGHCSRCAAELEVNLSRRLGIGPVCLEHFEPDSEKRSELKAEARAELRAAGIDPDDKHDDLSVLA